jgi:HD-like signal output (HDOD) protein/DNA-binding CsgD family transcriptional regulator
MPAAPTTHKLHDQPKKLHLMEKPGHTTISRAGADQHHEHVGHGRRLMMAFDALEEFPVLVESRNRLLSAISGPQVATADLVSAVESDIALIVAVLRLANTPQSGRGRIDTAASAVELLHPQAIYALADRVNTFDFFENPGVWNTAPECFRLHALATQRAADRIASVAGYKNRERLAVTSLLHDIGKLVLIYAYNGYPGEVHQQARTPEERVQQESRELGVDHALVGGVLIRRWGLPASLATAVEHHHSPGAKGEAAIIRLADMLAHHEQGVTVSPSEMIRSARAIGLGTEELRALMYELPRACNQRQRPVEKCPLTGQEFCVLQQLAKGSVYKEIAQELDMNVSTVRTHLHNTYHKLGVVDRAQAVIFATERGWL